MKSDTLHSIDMKIGKRMQEKRILHGMSQTELGTKLGLTFQQIQKYEKGMNRISASRLYELSIIFREPIACFFSGLPHVDTFLSPDTRTISKNDVELIKSYKKISNHNAQKALRLLIKSISK